MIAPIIISGLIVLGLALIVTFVALLLDGEKFSKFWASGIPIFALCLFWTIISATNETIDIPETYKMVVTENAQFVLTKNGNSYNLTRVFKKSFSPEKCVIKVATVNPWSYGIIWWPREKVQLRVIDANGNVVDETFIGN